MSTVSLRIRRHFLKTFAPTHWKSENWLRKPNLEIEGKLKIKLGTHLSPELKVNVDNRLKLAAKSGMDGEAFFSRGGAGKESKFVEQGGPGRGTPPPSPQDGAGRGTPPSPRGGFPPGGASIPDRDSVV